MAGGRPAFVARRIVTASQEGPADERTAAGVACARSQRHMFARHEMRAAIGLLVASFDSSMSIPILVMIDPCLQPFDALS